MAARFMLRSAPQLLRGATSRGIRALNTSAPRLSAHQHLRPVLPSTLRAFSAQPHQQPVMSDADKAQIAETWKIVEKDLETHAVTFYKAMLELGPPIRQLFVARNEFGFLPEDSEDGLKKHSVAVMVMIGHAVAGLNNLEEIKTELHDLAQRHAKYGVEMEHFPIMRDALFITLEKELGDKWTPQVKDAWWKAYETCQVLMEGPMMEEHKRLGNYKDSDYMQPEKPH